MNVVAVPGRFLNNFVTDFYHHLSTMAADALGGVVQAAEDFNPACDVLFVVSLSHWPRNGLDKLERLPSCVRVVCWHDDLFWATDRHRRTIDQTFARSDLIIHGSKYAFLDLWGKYEAKSRWLPLFASPYFFRGISHRQAGRCLLSGATREWHYPFRHFVKSAGSPYVDVLGHPGYRVRPGDCVGKKYASLLGSYFCCVTCGGSSYGACKYSWEGRRHYYETPLDDCLGPSLGVFKTRGQVLLKFFEIPAVGSLLITDGVPELEEMGFVAGENYVRAGRGEVLEAIEDCCKNRERYERVKRRGWVLARKHHPERRAEALRAMLAEVGLG